MNDHQVVGGDSADVFEHFGESIGVGFGVAQQHVAGVASIIGEDEGVAGASSQARRGSTQAAAT